MESANRSDNRTAVSGRSATAGDPSGVFQQIEVFLAQPVGEPSP
jgi:hypothetical protein